MVMIFHTAEDAPTRRRERALLSCPAWLRRAERVIGARVPLHPNTLSALKLVAVTPLLLATLTWPPGALLEPLIVIALFIAFAGLDYLDGVVARERGLATGFGRVFDRVTDYPLLVGVSLFCVDVVPMPLIITKLALDLLLLVLFVLGCGSTQNRLRTVLSYTTLLALLTLSQGWLVNVVTPTTVKGVLLINIALSGTVALYNLDLLKKSHVADILSLSNLTCGLLAIHTAAQGRFVSSLLLLLLGATFDGFDGIAARRWGSSRWGVYSDDVADGVNFGIAPAAAVYFAIGGPTGACIAAAFAICTIGRLVFFTINKKNADPGYFSGVPSTVGGLITICAVILFQRDPAALGLMVGVACTLMVSFATGYRHVGRVLARRPKLLYALPLAFALLAAAWRVTGVVGPVSILLLVALGYGIWPIIRTFVHAATSG